MEKFSQLLSESFAEKEGKRLHLDHLQDLPILYGSKGISQAVGFLRSLSAMLAGHSSSRHVDVSVKFDGAPAIVCGINPENGKFFVATKSAFAMTPKLNYSPSDIDKNHPAGGLNKKLKIALKYLPELGITDIVQGDMMYTTEDLVTEEIGGQNFLTFTPNTITYAIPMDDPLAHRIRTSKMGIVFHTTYYGPSIINLKASPGVATGKFKETSHVWFRDATYVDVSGSATFTTAEADLFQKLLSQIANFGKGLDGRFLNTISNTGTYKQTLLAWNNLKVREGIEITDTRGHTLGFIQSVESRYNRDILDAKRPDTKASRTKEKTLVVNFWKNNISSLKTLFDFQNLVVEAKHLLIRKLEQINDIGTFLKTPDGYRVTKPEGFVVSDHLTKQAVKLVSQLEFSRANFTTQKSWK